MNAKRHQILGKNLHNSVSDCLDVLRSSDQDDRALIAAGNRSQFGFRLSLILASLHYPVLEHLGYGPIEDLRQRLDEGMDAAVDYFFGDWWRADKEDARVFGTPGLDHDWLRFDALPAAMLIGGLTGRWNDV